MFRTDKSRNIYKAFPQKVKTVLRLTRHPFLPEQQHYLQQRIGDFQLVSYADTLNVSALRELERTYRPDVVEIIGPLTLIPHALRVFANATLMRAIMTRDVKQTSHGVARNFSHYEKILSFTFETEPL